MRLNKKILAILLIIVFILSGCNNKENINTSSESSDIEKYFIKNEKPNNQLYIYGEIHGQKEILEAEFEYWQRYYNDGMRHLFLEVPYYTAQYYNIWMKEDDNEILDFIFSNFKDTPSGNKEIYDFFVS